MSVFPLTKNKMKSFNSSTAFLVLFRLDMHNVYSKWPIEWINVTKHAHTNHLDWYWTPGPKSEQRSYIMIITYCPSEIWVIEGDTFGITGTSRHLPSSDSWRQLGRIHGRLLEWFSQPYGLPHSRISDIISVGPPLRTPTQVGQVPAAPQVKIVLGHIDSFDDSQCQMITADSLKFP